MLPLHLRQQLNVPQAGLGGRLPVKPVGERFAIQWAHEYLAVAIPPPVYPIDVTGGITDFGLMGNGDFGNCGPCGEVHTEMTTAVAAKTVGPPPTSTLAITRYQAYTGVQNPPGPGVNLADYLLWCYNKGYIKAFAPVDYTNRAICDGLMQIGFGLYVGVNLCDNSISQFNNNQQTWDPAGMQPDPNEGHCIEKVFSDGKTLDGYVTWGLKQLATFLWTETCVEEAWLIVTTQEQLALFTPQLLVDINALGGTGGSTTPPPPPPPPKPGPPPVPPISPGHPVWYLKAEAWYKAAVAWLKGVGEDV